MMMYIRFSSAAPGTADIAHDVLGLGLTSWCTTQVRRLCQRRAGAPAASESLTPNPYNAQLRYGDYANGAPGRPLLVSLLVYLDAAWPRDWGAETLFLDGRSDIGVAVRPL